MMVENALALAKMGFKVFPLFPKTKKPNLLKFPKLATTDEAQIRLWWSGTVRQTKPSGRTWIISQSSNVGIHCEGMCVIDVDVKDAPGFDEFKAIPSPKTLVNKTTSGGAHFLYRLPQGMTIKNVVGGDKNRQDPLKWPWPHIDIRTKGGYIVAPGSVYKGKLYEWVNLGTPISMLHPGVLPYLDITSGGAVESDFGAVGSELTDLPDVVPFGGRDASVYRYCCSWRARDLSREEAEAKLRELFKVIEQPVGDPFTWEDCIAKLDQAWAYPAGTEATQAVAEVAAVIAKDPEGNAYLPAINLEECLERYVYIQETNTIGDLRRRSHIPKKNFETVLLPFPHPNPAGRGAPIKLATKWLSTPTRKVVDNISYYPDMNVQIHEWEGGKYFNLYHAPFLPVIKNYDPTVFKPYTDHLHYMFPDKQAYEFILDFQAFCVQYPAERCTFAVLIVSSQGIGKEVMFEMMNKCVGEKNARRITAAGLKKSSDFNGFLVENVVILIDEIKVKGVEYDDLKEMVTARRKEINKKFSTMQQEDIYSNIIMFTNHMDALTLEPDDRRFYVYESPAEYIDDSKYYKRLFDGILKSTSMPAHFRSFLLQRDISKFEPKKKPPVTAAKLEMEESTQDLPGRMVSHMLENKVGPFRYDIISYALILHCLDTDKFEGKMPSYETLHVILKKYMRKRAFPIKKLVFKKPLAKGEAIDAIHSKSPRVFCIRNHSKWVKAGVAAVKREFLCAHAATQNPNKADKDVQVEVNLREVKEV